MSHTCPKCNTAHNNAENPMLVRTYQSKEDRPRELYAIGYLGEDGHFQAVEQPDFKGIAYDLVDDDTCLGCIDNGEKYLTTDLFEEDGEFLPSFITIQFDSKLVKQLINTQNFVKSSPLAAGIIDFEPTYFLSNLSKDDDPSIEEIQEDHESFMETESVGFFTQDFRIESDGYICLDIAAHAGITAYAQSNSFGIGYLLKLEDEDLIFTQ